jgi:hypothetical protein
LIGPVRAYTTHGNIGLPVTIEVTYHNPAACYWRHRLGGLKRPIAVSPHLLSSCVGVTEDDVKLLVVIEISNPKAV